MIMPTLNPPDGCIALKFFAVPQFFVYNLEESWNYGISIRINFKEFLSVLRTCSFTGLAMRSVNLQPSVYFR